MYNPDTTESDDGDDDDDKITKIRDVLNWPDAFLAGSPYYMVLSGVLKNF